MRTTVTIDDQVLAEAKAVAARTGRTLSEVVEDALREVQAQRAAGTGTGAFKLHTFDGGGTLAGVDLNSNAALLDLIEGDAPGRD